MFGRGDELAVLGKAIGLVAAGRGGLVWMQGEPGIGKSTMVEVMATDALAAGCTVRRGAGDELMQAFPLRLMADCLEVSAAASDQGRAQIARLLRGEATELVTLDPVLAAAERLLDLVDRICAAGPLVLIAEDLHWADEPSLLVWNRLTRAVDQIPLLLVGTCRPVPHRASVDGLRAAARERGDAYLELGPLDTEAVVQIAGELAAGTPGPRLAAELVRAGGNPLYVRELVDALIRDGLVEAVDGVAELHAAAGAMPASLSAAIERRLGFLTDDTVKALRLAALLGHEFEVGHWSVVTGRSSPELAHAAGEAVAAGVLSEAGPRLMFRHDLIRQALVDRIPAPVRASMHRQAAQLLAQAGAGVDVVGRHLIAIHGPMDGWVIDWLAGSPESTLYAVSEVSAEILTGVVDGLESRDPRWEPLAARLARVLFWLGNYQRAEEVAEAVLRQTSDIELSAELTILMIRSAGNVRHYEEAAARAESALADERLPLKWRARLTALSAIMLVGLGRAERAQARAREALRDAQRCADPLSVGYAWNALAWVVGDQSQIPHIKHALAALGDDPESVYQRIMLLRALHQLSVIHKQPEEADAAIGEALLVAERAGSVHSSGVLGQAATACYFYGRWDEALVHIDTVTVGPEHIDQPWSMQLRGLAALVCLHREDQEGAEQRLRIDNLRGEADALLSTYPWVSYLPEALAIAQEVGGNLDRALAIRRTWLDLPSGAVRDARRDEALYLIRLALAVGDGDTARAAADAAQPDAGSAPDRVLAARCCRALVDGDTGQLLEVAEEYRRFRWPLHVAFALEEAADRLAGQGEAPAARAALNEAVRVYDGLGATWDIRRIDARMRRQGIRRGPRTTRRNVATGWDALTPAESRIAGLVAEGLSNPDIATKLLLSRNTVQTHVSHILAKLRLRSRVELVQHMASRTHGETSA